MSHFTISAIIPVRNGQATLPACLTALRHAAPPPDETIVVDDGSTDDSAAIARQMGATVIRVATPHGPAQARNLGAESATGDILFFVDADVAIAPDAVAQIRHSLQTGQPLANHRLSLSKPSSTSAVGVTPPHIAAVFGSYDDSPAAPNFLSQYKNLLHHYVHQMGNDEAFTFWAGCGAVRRAAFEAVGGFDVAYRQPSIEDIELGYRLRRAGYAIRLCKALQGKHLKRWGVVSLLKADIWQRALPWTELILRHRQVESDLNLNQTSRLSVLAVFWGGVSFVLGLWQRRFWLGLIFSGGILLWLNRSLYAFFYRKRGGWFTIGAIGWHWLYFAYGGAAFGVGLLRFWVTRLIR